MFRYSIKMPSKSKKKIIDKKQTGNKKKSQYEYNDDEDEIFMNSEDEKQSGGLTEEEKEIDELDSDSDHLDADPDDEDDPNGDGEYDPHDEAEELEDPDKENDNEDEAADENADEAGEEGENEGEGEAEGEAGEEGEDGAYTGEAKVCHMKNLDKDFIVLDEDDSSMYGKMEYKKVAKEDRQSDAIMTYYEMVRVIGTRAQQFNFEAPPLVTGIDNLPAAQMAYIELITKQTPYIIRRYLPGKTYEEFEIAELELIHEISDDFFVPEKFNWDKLMEHVQKSPENIDIVTKKNNNSKKK